MAIRVKKRERDSAAVPVVRLGVENRVGSRGNSSCTPLHESDLSVFAYVPDAITNPPLLTWWNS